MTNSNDRNRQIRAKNLFEEESPEERAGRSAAAEKNVQSLRNTMMGSVPDSSGALSGRSGAPQEPASRRQPQGAKGSGRSQGRAAGTSQAQSQSGQAVRRGNAGGQAGNGRRPAAGRGALDSTGRTAAGGKKEVSSLSQRRTAGKGKKYARGKKSPRQKQESHRFYATAGMAFFVLFVAGWGVCQLVRSINMGESQRTALIQPGEVVVDNSANAGKDVDVDKLVNRILDNVTFDAELNLLEDSVAYGMVSTAAGTDLRIYMGNGTYADELVVMTARSESDAEKNQQSAENHLQEMKKQFSEYIPREAKKIDGAVKVRCGCYVVVCVTSDTETAGKEINEMLKK